MKTEHQVIKIHFKWFVLFLFRTIKLQFVMRAYEIEPSVESKLNVHLYKLWNKI